MDASPSKVDVVVANWFPRFVANDLDYLDVRRTLDAIDDWDDWAPAWEAAAERYASLGQQAVADGALITAGEHLRRAAITLQFGQFVLTDDPVRREELHRRQIDLYRQAAPLLRHPAEPYRLPAGDAVVHGYVRLPADAGHDPAPVVILVPGLESTKEQFSSLEPYFLDRGMATVSMEGPGQGEGWYDHPFDISTYVNAFEAVRAWIGTRPDLDDSRVGVLGTSFGGHLALRCAADTAPGLRGVVAMAGSYEVDLPQLQPVLQDGFTHLSGATDVDDAARRLSDVTLSGHLDHVDTDVLLVHGDDDHVIPIEHGDRIARDLGDRVEYDRIAGGNHSCQNLHTTVRPRVADWLATRLLG